MRAKKCRSCGKIYQTDKQGSYMCPDCALEIKRDSLLRQRTCKDCGATFVGFPVSKRCPSCQAEADRQHKQAYMRSGPRRPLGSDDICVRCGKPYIVEGGSQKFCKDCSAEGVKATARPRKRAYNREYLTDERTQYKNEVRTGNKVCVICGAPILAKTATVTCSPACDRERRRRIQNEADIRRGRRKLPADQQAEHNKPQSGVTGVTWHKGKWQAVWKQKYLGVFSTIPEAAAAIETYKASLPPEEG